MHAWMATMRKRQASFYGNDFFIRFGWLTGNPTLKFTRTRRLRIFYIFLCINFRRACLCSCCYTPCRFYRFFGRNKKVYLDSKCVRSGVLGFFLTAQNRVWVGVLCFVIRERDAPKRDLKFICTPTTMQGQERDAVFLILRWSNYYAWSLLHIIEQRFVDNARRFSFYSHFSIVRQQIVHSFGLKSSYTARD